MADSLRLILTACSSSLHVSSYARRLFSTTIRQNANPPKEKPRSPMDIQVVRLQISPFKWIRQQVVLFLLKRIDPEFNIDDCTAGATKVLVFYSTNTKKYTNNFYMDRGLQSNLYLSHYRSSRVSRHMRSDIYITNLVFGFYSLNHLCCLLRSTKHHLLI